MSDFVSRNFGNRNILFKPQVTQILDYLPITTTTSDIINIYIQKPRNIATREESSTKKVKGFSEQENG